MRGGGVSCNCKCKCAGGGGGVSCNCECEFALRPWLNQYDNEMYGNRKLRQTLKIATKEELAIIGDTDHLAKTSFVTLLVNHSDSYAQYHH